MGDLLNWFEKTFGFTEGSYYDTKQRLSVDGPSISINGVKINHGTFTNPTCNEIFSLEKKNTGKSVVSEIVGDVGVLHEATPNAVFQVASQFNCLEMYHPGISKYSGITGYEHDYTQGPACAMACGVGTLYRNYFTDVNNLELFDPMLWDMQNGYCLPHKHKAHLLKDLDLGDLKIGIHHQTPVSGTSHNVTQVFCSALPLSYIDFRSDKLDDFAKRILVYSYAATLAVANSNKLLSNKVFLTMLGGGAFGNKEEWIIAAIEKAIDEYMDCGLEIGIVSYGKSNPNIQKLVAKYSN